LKTCYHARVLRRRTNKEDQELRRLREEVEQQRWELAEALKKATERAERLRKLRARVEAAEKERDRLAGEVDTLRSQLHEVRRDEPAVAADPPVFFVFGHGKSGKAGDWRDAFTERDKDISKRAAGKTLVEIGYERDADW
jgi:seryl-tRNA synthetase